MPVEDRAAEIWEPLIQIADAAGGEWPVRTREAAVYFTEANAEYEARTDGVDLLEHIRDAFMGAERIWTTTLLGRLVERDESPWADVQGRPLEARGLGKRLAPYRVKSRDVKIDGMVRKGFHKSDFHDLWASYLDNHLSATSATSATKLISKSKKVAEVAEVAANPGNCETAEVIVLRKREPIIAAVLTGEDHCTHIDDFYAFQERAAITEFDGGLSRQEAEALAADEFPELPSFLDRRRAS